jgi:hypothetical protein
MILLKVSEMRYEIVRPPKGRWGLNILSMLHQSGMCRGLRLSKERLRQWMQTVVNTMQEVTCSTHKGVPKASEVATISHFFCKYVGWNAFATPLMCDTEMLPSLTHSLTAFSWCSICQLPLVVMSWHHFTQASLSLYTVVAASVSVMGLSRDER